MTRRTRHHAEQRAYKEPPQCTLCRKETYDYYSYFLCNHKLCEACDLLHDQLTCDLPSYLRMEREAVTKARDVVVVTESPNPQPVPVIPVKVIELVRSDLKKLRGQLRRLKPLLTEPPDLYAANLYVASAITFVGLMFKRLEPPRLDMSPVSKTTRELLQVKPKKAKKAKP